MLFDFRQDLSWALSFFDFHYVPLEVKAIGHSLRFPVSQIFSFFNAPDDKLPTLVWWGYSLRLLQSHSFQKISLTLA